MKTEIVYYLLLLVMIGRTSSTTLSIEDCDNLIDESGCDYTCPNQLCINKRFKENEQQCYVKDITSLPDDALETMIQNTENQEFIVRQYHTLLAYTDNRTNPSAMGPNLLGKERKEILKSYFPMREFKRDDKKPEEPCEDNENYIVNVLNFNGCNKLNK